MTCQTEYLKRYPDVARHEYYGDKPQEHYDTHGRSEGRKACKEWQRDLTCEEQYLVDHKDVAGSSYKDNPERHYQEWGRNEGRKVCVLWKELYPPDVPDSQPELPIGRYITINDFNPSLRDMSKGDPDSSQDFGAQIALMFHYNSKPLAIGCSQTEGKNYTSIPSELLEAAKLDVPILKGHPSKGGAGKSALSKFVVSESKKGKLALIIGGTTGDVSRALKDGATASNITLYLTRNTWNEQNSDGATEYITSRCITHQVPTSDLYHTLGEKGKPFDINGLSANKWIDQNRNIKMWAMANNQSVIQAIRNINTFMSQFKDNHPLRIADALHLTQYFGAPNNGHLHHFNVINNGLKIMRRYQ